MAYLKKNGITFLKNLPDRCVDGIFTDPPWGSCGPKIVGQKEWLSLLKQMDKECPRILKPRARVLIWIGSRMLGNLLKAINHLEYKYLFLCRYIPPRYIGCFVADHDPIAYFSLPGEKMYYRKGKTVPQVFLKPSTGKSDTKHPCARPIQVVTKLLRELFKEGEYVIDPFAGSDTTGVGCDLLGIRSDTCEVDPKMYKTGIARREQEIFKFEDFT